MEELFDKELQGMVKFTDATQQQAAATQQQKAAGKPAAAKKNVPQQKPVQRDKAKAQDGEWYPVKGEPTYIERLKGCVKWVGLFGGLVLLLFYWQQTGQMESSAAVPSMLVCALLAGVGVGMNWTRR